MGWSAFRATGQTVAITAGTTASVPVQVPSSPGEQGTSNYLVSNAGSTPAFIAFGSSAMQPVSVPNTTGPLPGSGIYLQPNSTRAFSAGYGSFVSVATASGTSTLYVTPGDGL